MNKVKQHTRKTKTGKISVVKEYSKSNIELTKRIRKLHGKVIDSAVKFIYPFKGKKVYRDDLKNYEENLEQMVKKFVAKNYSKKEAKRKTRLLLENLKSSSYKVFKNKRLNIVLLENKSKPKERTESKFKYFFSDGKFIDDTIKSSRSIHLGDTFYSQKINDNEKWKETLGRKKLKVMQISKLNEDKAGTFKVLILKIDKGEMKETNKILTKEEIFNLMRK